MLIIFFIVYLMTEFFVMVMNVFSAYTGLLHFMVGLTFIVWRGVQHGDVKLGVSNQQVTRGCRTHCSCKLSGYVPHLGDSSCVYFQDD